MATSTLLSTKADSRSAGSISATSPGAPNPPRPKAVATFLSSNEFLPGCQTLLHSLKKHSLKTPKNQYPHEIIVIVTSKVSSSTRAALYPIFCTRILEVDHILMPGALTNGSTDNGDVKRSQKSHISAWDENCGLTKLRLFEMDNYDTILYIDADCLVVKDVTHLLGVDRDEQLQPKEQNDRRTGLLAAAPDVFPPDKFNAGLMVLRPSKAVFADMMSMVSSSTISSYDGGDTGFLNAYYPNWFRDMPPYSRLPFGYNAQRFMHHCTYEKQPKYWDEGIGKDSLHVVHFSSSPKPWEEGCRESRQKIEATSPASYLDETEIHGIKHGKLERLWQTSYKESQAYFFQQMQKQQQQKPAALAMKPPTNTSPATSKRSAPPPARNTASTFQKRFKELRASGMDSKTAMHSARSEYGLDRTDGADPCRAVGQMFGL